METLLDPALQSCPYAYYQRLRAESPVYRMPDTGFYLITNYELCREIIREPDIFVSGVTPMNLNPEAAPEEVSAIYRDHGWMPAASCSTSDPPRHTQVRALLSKLFTTAKVRSMVPHIRETAHHLVDGFMTGGECEFVNSFSHPLPMIIIAEQIGVSTRDLDTFKEWSDAIVEMFGMMISRQRQLECARLIVDMQHFFKQQIDLRREHPQDDLLTILADSRYENGQEIPMNELLTIVTVDLLASGNETTTAGISSGTMLLAEQPQLLATLKAEPELIPVFVEEVLRLESPAQGMFREVVKETTLGGTFFKPGDILSLRFGAANRDEAEFPDADQVNLQREKPGKHLAFGVGRHHCIGAPLARQEMLISFQVLIQRLEDIRLKYPAKAHPYTPSFFGRNLQALDIEFKAAR
ncbi:cytochrome P450 [Seongchinamella unica]|uniref:Cytochrome P450 n=2 Tax=Seongchinamella unica TaxID=2547392 RepID=A0A4R5LR80_9GAMM|nr:cytochrome P450 [Seongchinamella unica]